ncbi:Zinc phosphodiesterase ELAC protein 1 [Blattella germanica]|nr:Zinc phosphodiesterase ELAC protein 1 [Blattella germanica]
MQIICLGTASCYPTANRSVSCTALRFEDGNAWIFDCGEGSQVQLQKSPLFGLPGLMCTLGNMVPDRENFLLEIYGPRGLRKFVRDTLILSKSALTYGYVVHELIPVAEQYPEDWNLWPTEDVAMGATHPQEKPGKDISANDDLIWNLFENQNVSVKAGPIKHKIPSFGFVIVERDEPGKLDSDKLKALGIPPGPLYARIKKGEVVTLPSGATVSFKMSSDIVLHEATLENSMEEKAIVMGHSTPRMAAQFAANVGAKDPCVDTLLHEAQEELNSQNCPAQLVLADDLLEYTVERPRR